MSIFYIMIVCLVSTLVIEIVCSIIFGLRDKLDIINVGLVNVLTNPLVVSITFFINIRYGYSTRMIAEIILEVCAVLSEGFIYSKVLKYKKINGYVLSLILNVISYSLGFVINSIIY